LEVGRVVISAAILKEFLKWESVAVYYKLHFRSILTLYAS
jgi:hypothetical protein